MDLSARNGAGKSTFLRILAGILQPDAGSVQIDGAGVYENTAVKQKCFMISDEQYFFSGATPRDMKEYYKTMYPHFDENRYRSLMSNFGAGREAQAAHVFQGHEKTGVCHLRGGVRRRLSVL